MRQEQPSPLEARRKSRRSVGVLFYMHFVRRSNAEGIGQRLLLSRSTWSYSEARTMCTVPVQWLALFIHLRTRAWQTSRRNTRFSATPPTPHADPYAPHYSNPRQEKKNFVNVVVRFLNISWLERIKVNPTTGPCFVEGC